MPRTGLRYRHLRPFWLLGWGNGRGNTSVTPAQAVTSPDGAGHTVGSHDVGVRQRPGSRLNHRGVWAAKEVRAGRAEWPRLRDRPPGWTR